MSLSPWTFKGELVNTYSSTTSNTASKMPIARCITILEMCNWKLDILESMKYEYV